MILFVWKDWREEEETHNRIGYICVLLERMPKKDGGKFVKLCWEEMPKSTRGLGRDEWRGNSERQNVTFTIFPKVNCAPLSGFPCHGKEEGPFHFHYLLLLCWLSLTPLSGRGEHQGQLVPLRFWTTCPDASQCVVNEDKSCVFRNQVMKLT